MHGTGRIFVMPLPYLSYSDPLFSLLPFPSCSVLDRLDFPYLSSIQMVHFTPLHLFPAPSFCCLFLGLAGTLPFAYVILAVCMQHQHSRLQVVLFSSYTVYVDFVLVTARLFIPFMIQTHFCLVILPITKNFYIS